VQRQHELEEATCHRITELKPKLQPFSKRCLVASLFVAFVWKVAETTLFNSPNELASFS